MWIEVPDELTFNEVNTQFKLLIGNEPMDNWAEKLFGNGLGGYYMPVPEGLRQVDGIEEIISEFSQYESLPPTLPPGSYTPISVIDDIEYSAGDFNSLGIVAEGLVLSEMSLLVKSNGDKYINILYRDGQIIIINCQTNTYSYSDSGIYKPWKAIYHEGTDSLIFFSAVGLKIVRYSITTETFVFDSEDTITSGTSNDAIIDRCMGTDGNIYFGATLSASVWKYEPSTDTITSFGPVDTISNSTYVYHIGADANYIYCGLRSQGVYWLVVYNQTDFSKTIIGKGNAFSGMSLTLKNSIDGMFWSIGLKTGNIPDISKKYKDGVDSGYIETGDLSYEIQEGRLDSDARNPTDWPSNFGTEIEGDNLFGLNSVASINYKEIAEEDFTYLEFPLLDKENYKINYFSAFGTNIYGGFSAYAPIFVYDTSLDTLSELHGYEGTSVYNVFPYTENKIYISGYPNDTREWDRLDEWNHGTYNDYSDLSNPQRLSIGLSNAYYHYFNTKSGDYLYTFWERTRNDSGSGLSWYDTVNKTITHSDTTMLAYLKNYNVSHIFTINSGNTLILLTEPRGISVLPKIFIFDITSEKNLNLLTPIEKELPFVNLPAGIGFDGGVNIFIGFIKNIVYKVDITDLDNIIIYNSPGNLSPLSFTACVSQKSDGSIWFLARPILETYLYRLDPTTFTVTRKSSDLGLLVYNRAITITSDDKLYLLGGNTSIAQFGGENSEFFLDKLEL